MKNNILRPEYCKCVTEWAEHCPGDTPAHSDTWLGYRKSIAVLVSTWQVNPLSLLSDVSLWEPSRIPQWPCSALGCCSGPTALQLMVHHRVVALWWTIGSLAWDHCQLLFPLLVQVQRQEKGMVLQIVRPRKLHKSKKQLSKINHIFFHCDFSLRLCNNNPFPRVLFLEDILLPQRISIVSQTLNFPCDY